ncbi:MAG: DUF2062 domain-containing protein [Candidatus Nanohaloarchaea archaeon]
MTSLKRKMMETLHEAFEEEHTDREIAFSFAFGIFVTSLPTLGLGLILFALLIKFTRSISRLAISASIVIMNPLTKWIFYLSSINLGSLILTGRLSGIGGLEEALKYLLIGSIVLAAILSILSYFVALKLVKTYRSSELEIIEEIDEAVEERLEA